MKNIVIIRIILAAVAIMLPAQHALASQAERAERRYISEGNRLFREKKYADAEVQYTKALETNASSMLATYNLASALARQASPGENGKKLLERASSLFNTVMQNDTDARLAELAAYNLGNIAYNNRQWDQSINLYKQALRKNPDNDKARQNLRMAQLKKKEQEQNKDKNKDQDKKDQDKKDQDKKDLNQDKQNQDKQNQDNKDQNKPQEQPKQNGGISDQNAEKILKAMENEEAATRRRIQEAQKRNNANASRRAVGNPW